MAYMPQKENMKSRDLASQGQGHPKDLLHNALVYKC
jgi:hypothetical protein